MKAIKNFWIIIVTFLLGMFTMYHVIIKTTKVYIEDECTVVLEIFQHEFIYESNSIDEEDFILISVHPL